jgi:nucleoside-diphosphate-sugar epimerase
MTKKTIGIIGCGWLGKALATQLLTAQYNVLTTVRSIEKQTGLAKQGIPTHCLSVPVLVNDTSAVFKQQILVILITPKFKQGCVDYADNIATIIHAAEKSGVEKVILVSSTAVYNGLSGEVNENSLLDFTAEKVAILHQAEQAVIQSSCVGQVLRLSGLVGEDRKPGRFLAGKKQLTGANEPVNVIHQIDAAGLLIKMIEQPIKQCDNKAKIYLGVSRTNATRSQYYKKAAQALSLQLPEFIDEDKPAVGKKIFGESTRQLLAYKYVHDDLYQ